MNLNVVILLIIVLAKKIYSPSVDSETERNYIAGLNMNKVVHVLNSVNGPTIENNNEKLSYDLPAQFADISKRSSTQNDDDRQTGVIYGDGKPIGILQPYEESYKFMPIKEETMFSLNGKRSELPQSDPYVNILYPLSRVSENNHLKRELEIDPEKVHFQEQYPSMLINFKIRDKLQSNDLGIKSMKTMKREIDANKRPFSLDSSKITDQQFDALKLAMSKYQSSLGDHDTVQIEENLRGLLNDAGLIENESKYFDENSINRLKSRREIKEDEDFEDGFKRPVFIKESLNDNKYGIDRKKRAELSTISSTSNVPSNVKPSENIQTQQVIPTKREVKNLLKSVQHSGDLTVTGLKNPVAFEAEIKGKESESESLTESDENENRVARDIKNKIRQLKEEVKREIRALEKRDANDDNEEIGDMQRKKRYIDNTLLDEESKNIDPNQNIDSDLKPHIRRRRSPGTKPPDEEYWHYPSHEYSEDSVPDFDEDVFHFKSQNNVAVADKFKEKKLITPQENVAKNTRSEISERQYLKENKNEHGMRNYKNNIEIKNYSDKPKIVESSMFVEHTPGYLKNKDWNPVQNKLIGSNSNIINNIQALPKKLNSKNKYTKTRKLKQHRRKNNVRNFKTSSIINPKSSELLNNNQTTPNQINDIYPIDFRQKYTPTKIENTLNISATNLEITSLINKNYLTDRDTSNIYDTNNKIVEQKSNTNTGSNTSMPENSLGKRKETNQLKHRTLAKRFNAQTSNVVNESEETTDDWIQNYIDELKKKNNINNIDENIDSKVRSLRTEDIQKEDVINKANITNASKKFTDELKIKPHKRKKRNLPSNTDDHHIQYNFGRRKRATALLPYANTPFLPYREDDLEFDEEPNELMDDEFDDRSGIIKNDFNNEGSMNSYLNRQTRNYYNPYFLSPIDNDPANKEFSLNKKMYAREKILSEESPQLESIDLPDRFRPFAVRRSGSRAKRYDLRDLAEPQQLLSEMSDTELFGALPQSYQGDLGRYKRVKRLARH